MEAEAGARVNPEEARQALGDLARRRPPAARYSDVEAGVRRRVASRAQSAAYTALARLHPEEYRALYDTARDAMLAQEGLR